MTHHTIKVDVKRQNATQHYMLRTTEAGKYHSVVSVYGWAEDVEGNGFWEEVDDAPGEHEAVSALIRQYGTEVE